jgi:hypothetical protein
VGTDAVVIVPTLVLSVTSQAHPVGAGVANKITPELAVPPVPTLTVNVTLDAPDGTVGLVPNPLLIVGLTSVPNIAPPIFIQVFVPDAGVSTALFAPPIKMF